MSDTGRTRRTTGCLPATCPFARTSRCRSKLPAERCSAGSSSATPQPGVFAEHHERLAVGIASWAGLALENARLYVAAREADQLKDQFLAVLSHELRTPLNAILGYARLIRGGVLTGEKAERGMETLERNASSLTQIVEDVLDVSRIVSGKIRLDVQPMELPLVVHNAVATVQPAADAKGVRLHTIVDPRAGPVAGDPERLQQVVWNLLSNAVKFTPKGGRDRGPPGAGGFIRRSRGQRYGDWNPARFPASRLRAVPSGGCRHDTQHRRARPGTVDRPQHRGDAWWFRPRGQ